jgi:hypothetical protein
MKMQYYTLIFLSLVLTSSLSGQTGARLGFKGGYSMSTQYGITPKDIPYTVDSDFRHGFAGGIFVYFPITDSFGVQQELLYATKGSRQYIAMNDISVSTCTKYDLNYMELPFVFRYTFVHLGNFKIYGSSGFALSILLNGSYDLNGTVNMGGTETTFGESGDMKGVDTFDYSLLYGAGFDFNLLNNKCFFEYRFTIGWNTLMMPTSEGEAAAPLRNQDYIFVLGIYL